MRSLLLGCGNTRDKRIYPNGNKEWGELTTVDQNPLCGADLIRDLNSAAWWDHDFTESSFDEIHAYETLEHLGQQGNVANFFGLFTALYRILKPGGFMCATTPQPESVWAWGDPGHTRIISKQTLTFLNQAEYAKQVGVTPMTDYRSLWWGDFKLRYFNLAGHSNAWVLEAIKPSRIGDLNA